MSYGFFTARFPEFVKMNLITHRTNNRATIYANLTVKFDTIDINLFPGSGHGNLGIH